MIDIWAACSGESVPRSIGGELLRMVESQEQVATTTLVDNLAEQAMLEELLELVKPPLRPGAERLHYLLASPFRYPPLTHGSRFGSRFEPSLFYAGRALAPTLAETAYYRYAFWTGMEQPPPSGRLLTQHTLFRARYRTDRGLHLNERPWSGLERTLRHPSEYQPTQELGKRMRSAKVEAFEYVSARDPECGVNVALFTPDALVSRRPLAQQPWLCETREDTVSLSANSGRDLYLFPITYFLVGGALPRPAS